jgi:membrane protein involved in colicin uptake
MSEYGYDWHQTTVGRVETATRPLRLNEAVALAALFEIPVTQLIAPAERVDEANLDAEIGETRERWAEAVAASEGARADAARAAEALKAAENTAAEADAQSHRLTGHLDYLLGVRAIMKGGPITGAQLIAASRPDRADR